MKIKARPDDAGTLESDELFQMNGWLAELRDEGRAESWDEGRSGAEENGCTKPEGDGRAGSRDAGQARLRDDSHAGPREDSRAGSRDAGRAGPGPDSYARSREDGRAGLRDDDQAGSRGDGAESSAGPRDSLAGPRGDGRARPQDDGQAKPPRRGHPRPEALAAASVTAPVTRAQSTARAVIGDQLRLPIVWCEMACCISWFAHRAALGEADIRARAIDAGWRVDAVGLLVCPQCVQTAADFQSPHPVVLWDREEAIAMTAQIADEPSAEAVASVARELSHDLRSASNPRNEVGAASAWIAAAPAGDVARSASGGTSNEVRHPADDHQPENHPRPGRHRKRLAAKLMFASH